MKYRRAILKNVEGYVPGEQPKLPHITKLNTNENPYPPSPRVAKAVQSITAEAIRRYPDPLALRLRSICAERYGYPGPEWVIAGNGMDEILALALRTFVDPGDAVISPYPTYILYETLTHLHGANMEFIDLTEDFRLPEAMFAAQGRLCFLPRPNSPTGVCAPRLDVERLCEAFDGLVVIDEAYVDFADDSCVDFPKRFENAIVTRTFSKAFSLAGMRLGVAVAHPDIIAEFLKTKDSYNLNAATQAAGIAAMEDYDFMLANSEKVRTTRARVVKELAAMGFDIPESQANFILARWNGTPSTETIFNQLHDRAIIVRYFRTPRLDNALRITIGTDAEMDLMLGALKEILGT